MTTQGTASDLAGTTALSPLVAEFDSAALAENYAEVRRLAGPDVEVWGSVKGDAYGHGVIEVCRRLDELGAFGVSAGSAAEAVAIRRAGVRNEIVLYGCHPPVRTSIFRDHRIVPTVYSLELAHAVAGDRGERQKVFVKVDCGLGRLGVPAREAGDFLARLAQVPGIEIYGVYTHLPFMDAAGGELTTVGLAAFREALDDVRDRGIEVPYVEALASAGVLCRMDPLGNLVNPGHMLYGLSPFGEPVADTSPLRPVLARLWTRLIHVARPSDATGAVSSVGAGYGIPTDVRRGILPIGSYHGLRLGEAGAWMLCRGVRVPVLRVSLEHTILDLSDAPAAAVGDEVVVVGPQGGDAIELDELAAWRGERPVHTIVALCNRAASVWR